MNGLATLVQGDAQNLPFLKDSFGLVLGLDCLEHFDDDRGVIGHVYRILGNGGRFIIDLPPLNRSSFNPLP